MAGTSTSKTLHRKVIRRNKTQGCPLGVGERRREGGVCPVDELSKHRRPPCGTTCSMGHIVRAERGDKGHCRPRFWPASSSEHRSVHPTVWCGLGRGSANLSCLCWSCSGTSCHCSVSPTPVFPFRPCCYLRLPTTICRLWPVARFAPAGVWCWIHGRADRPIADRHYSILDFVLRLKLIFYFSPCPTLACISSPTLPSSQRRCVSSAASPGLPPPRLSSLLPLTCSSSCMATT